MHHYQALVSQTIFALSLSAAMTGAVGCDADSNDDCGPGQLRDGERCIPDEPVPGCLDTDAANFSADATEDDGSCIYDVAFAVDVAAEELDASDIVYLRGSFNEFAATATPMSDDDGDDVWETSLTLASGTYEYVYSIGDIAAGGISEAAPVECDFNPEDAVPNRGFVVADAPLALDVHAYGSCDETPPPPPPTFEPITFDDAEITYTLTNFGGVNDAMVIVDPGDENNRVVRVVRADDAAIFAGTTVSTLENFAIPPIPFQDGSTRMTVRVLSPVADIQVRLKVEDSTDNGKTVETEATITVADAFETLTFDFANQATDTAAINFDFTYDKISIFFNFGAEGSVVGEQVFLFDDIEFAP